jgi:cytoskeleton protein RodZ
MSADRTSGGFGATLRNAREGRGVSLRQIANATKISVAALEALERNDISRLPGGIFSRAFVRSYAIEVGLDPEATIAEFVAHFPNDSVTAGHPTSEQVEDNEAHESDRRMAGTFLWLFLISIPVAGTVLYFATAGRRVEQGAPPVVAAPASDAAGSADPPPIAVPDAALVTASAPPAAARTVTPPSPSPPATAPPPAPAAADTVGDHLTIVLSVKRPCVVLAIVDGRKAIDRLLQAGDTQTIEVRKEMSLTAGDAAAIAMTINGANARPLGKAGEVVATRVTLNNFKDYLLVR